MRLFPFSNLFPVSEKGLPRPVTDERGRGKVVNTYTLWYVKAGPTPSSAALIVIETRYRMSKCICAQTTVSLNKMLLDSRADHQSMKGPVPLLSLRQVPTVRLCYRT